MELPSTLVSPIYEIRLLSDAFIDLFAHNVHFSSDVSRRSDVSISVYLRTMHGQDDMGNDLLMARIALTPSLDAHVGFVTINFK